MTRLASLLALCLLFASPVLAFDTEAEFDDPVLNERYRSLIREIRCPKCLNESIAESHAPVAADLRREVRRLIGEGASDDEVKTFLSSRYGEFVLYRPPVSPATWALWGGPFVFLGVGGFVFWRILKTRRDQPIDEDFPA
ncbi:MAG TPA: cytochrome c-type biogenesis protein [Gammaproteobacteria bacterium]|nr:cytochrome c-type biogenesis protein [Gammaproteobacteria bacterium]